MNQLEMFGRAKWIGADEKSASASLLVRRCFTTNKKSRAKLKLIGLGTFEVYINGKRVSEDCFLPLNSEYENIDCPNGEKLAYRIYATEYDVSSYLKNGENVLAVLLGFGWYTGIERWEKPQKVYGNKKLIYSLELADEKGAVEILVSDGCEKYREAFVAGGNLHMGEKHDYREWNEDCLLPEFDASDWKNMAFEKPVESEYLYTDCPADTVFEHRSARLIYKSDAYSIYDAGRNISGYPILRAAGKDYSEIRVTFSERLDDSGIALDHSHIHGQAFDALANCESGDIYPRFTWYAFRFFKVEGNAEVQSVAVVHTNVKVDSDFKSDNETLNWIYKTFIDTQLANMHRGIPSDCPHIERLGYTGDGQLVCRSALHTFAAEAFYRKWIGDISDCQDRKTGHVQYTAPYVYAGGGPGGWGSAIITVPYEFWKYYGDKTVLSDMFSGMLQYLDFLEAHCDSNLVISDIEGVWCLGDWCTPPDQSNIPAPFVNTYFYIRSMQRVLEIADAIGRSDEVSYLEERIEKCKASIDKFYFNALGRDKTYVGNVRGASAFALSAGLGTELTAEKLISYYERLGHYDTGIFGTELVTRCLFELGRADVAYRLLTADEPHGFGKWRKNGETTFPEYWGVARSHNHPMFGAVVACFFEYILGIRQERDSAGYDSIVISPASIQALSHAEGFITTPHGRISVSYTKSEAGTEYKVEIPAGVVARIAVEGMEEKSVGAGIYTFKV
ncbi:MAG: family 78 glycoside hydrolase catalytic domain [Clostridia bacterium]|nr:family 78 glycoside hydrolase catalytic domain [Clostridia bacterium]